MLVSVIIPTYKRSERLPKAIDSVLNQTHRPIEIIVVDDNNDDDYRKETQKSLAPYITKHQIKYMAHKTNQGGCAARNTGAFHAQGEYLAFLDDDDFYEPTKIEAQLKVLNRDKNLDACMCSMYRIDENNQQIHSRENQARGTTLKTAILDGNLFTSMLLIKTKVFRDLGGFSEIPRFQDKYFHYKFLEHQYKIGVLDQPLLTLVEHSDYRISLSANQKVVRALQLLRQFEIKHRAIFTKKEWRYLTHRFYYQKAYQLCQGNIKQKFVALISILKSLGTYTGDFNVAKVALKAVLSNFILNPKTKTS